jgi:hypothetical protein
MTRMTMTRIMKMMVMTNDAMMVMTNDAMIGLMMVIFFIIIF